MFEKFECSNPITKLSLIEPEFNVQTFKLFKRIVEVQECDATADAMKYKSRAHKKHFYSNQ